MRGRVRLRFGGITTSLLVALMADGAGAAEPPEGTPPLPPVQARRAGEGLEQIVVSARKREEKLQDAPLSLVAFSATALRKADVRRLDDLTRFTPNLKLETATGLANAAAVAIRGVGNPDSSPTRDNGVGVYVDGVYLARAQSQVLRLNDIERVEVLRGPQGTLFGRNTVGGAINVITRKPGPEFFAEAGARVGNLNLFESNASVNVPLVPEKASALLSFQSITREGYTENKLTGQETDDRRSLGLRAALRLNPTENLDILLSGEQSRSHQAGRGGECRYNPAFLSTAPAVQAEQLSGFRFIEECIANEQNDELTYESPVRSKENLDSYGLTSQISYERGDLTFRSLTSWQRQENEGRIDLTLTDVIGPGVSGRDATPFGLLDFTRDQNDQVSQEFNLNGEAFGGALDYTIGAFAFYEKTRPGQSTQLVSFNLCNGDPNALVFPADFEQALKPVFAPLGQDPNLPLLPVFKQIAICNASSVGRGPRIRTNAYAGFGQFTYDLTDRLHVTGGLRYSVEAKSFRFTTANFVNPSVLLDPFAAAPIGSQSERFDKWTPLANVSYELSDSALVYASYARGFKSGGLNGRPNASVPSTLQPFDQEILDSYEVGYKSAAFDNRLQTNLALFYGRYDDIQQTILSASGAGQFAARVANASEAVIRGAELEILAAPFLGLDLRMGLGFIDAEYREFDDLARGPIVNGVQTFIPISRRNEDFINTPNFQGTFSVAYTLYDLLDTGDLTTQLHWYHQNEVNYASSSDTLVQGTYGLLGAQVVWKLADERTELVLFGDNLLDRRYLNGGVSFEDGFALGGAFFGAPRTYGLEIRRRF